MNVKVSIIIPVYNVEDYLRECLNSVINQNLKEIEIIAINDGSTDKSLSILQEYQLKYDNIKIINQNNKGLSESRNRGLREAKGEYIYFLDSDDYIHEELANICYHKCKENNLDIITFDASIFYNENKLEENNIFNYSRKGVLKSNVSSGIAFYEESMNKKAYKSSVCLYMYKRDFLESYELKFYPNILHEDELFTIKSILLAEKIQYIENIFFYRRVRYGSIMTTKKDIRNSIGYYTVGEQLYLFYKNNYNYDNNCNILLNHISGFYNAALTIITELDYYDKYISNMIRKSIKKKKDIKNLKLNLKVIFTRLLYIRNKLRY